MGRATEMRREDGVEGEGVLRFTTSERREAEV
jgi:hypothetical protein